jgi:hypothetical protein
MAVFDFLMEFHSLPVFAFRARAAIARLVRLPPIRVETTWRPLRRTAPRANIAIGFARAPAELEMPAACLQLDGSIWRKSLERWQ